VVLDGEREGFPSFMIPAVALIFRAV